MTDSMPVAGSERPAAATSSECAVDAPPSMRVRRHANNLPIVVGSGSSGIVYDAEPTSLKEGRVPTVVKKIMPAPLTLRLDQAKLDEVARTRTLGEQLIGPRVFGEDVRCPRAIWFRMEAMVMDLEKWKTLSCIASNGEQRELARAAVEYLVRRMHEAGFAHNDLHTTNVMGTWDADGFFTFRLLDFGNAAPYGAAVGRGPLDALLPEGYDDTRRLHAKVPLFKLTAGTDEKWLDPWLRHVLGDAPWHPGRRAVDRVVGAPRS
jgi:serine/threonine protein kinase